MINENLWKRVEITVFMTESISFPFHIFYMRVSVRREACFIAARAQYIDERLAIMTLKLGVGQYLIWSQ